MVASASRTNQASNGQSIVMVRELQLLHFKTAEAVLLQLNLMLCI